MAKRTAKESPRRETDLFGPVHDYLEAQGYTVRAEVNGCDVTARKGDDLIVIELKLHFGIDLLIQATERQRISDSVYVAIPAPDDMGRSRKWRGVKRLLRQLELGLILVFLDGPKPRIEVLFHPLPYQRQKRTKTRRAVIKEMEQRSGNYNQGGSSGRKLVTAYRENAVFVACCLERLGPSAPKALRDLGTGPKTTTILSSNFYGWFDRVEHGVYALTAQGRQALDEYPVLANQYREQIAQSLAEKRK
ncbi:MAG: hypothetical protein QG656_928 [Candidatus Hydrogenedentes bacterium]|nr:hypothetical protein [Candidatus Hydrogenedentota bacterium]